MQNASPEMLKWARNYQTPEAAFAQQVVLKGIGKNPAKGNFQVKKMLIDGQPQWVKINLDTNETTPMGAAPAGSGQQINVDVGDKTFQKKILETSLAALKEAGKGAQSAEQMLPMLNILNKADIYTGPFADEVQYARRLGSVLGLPTNANIGDLVTSAQNQMALIFRNPASGMGLPGATSERELDFLLAAVPGMAQTVEGRKQLAEILTLTAKVKRERYDQMKKAYREAKKRREVFDVNAWEREPTPSEQKLIELSKKLFPEQGSGGTPSPQRPRPMPAAPPPVGAPPATRAPGGGAPVDPLDAAAAKYGLY
jgi:hypothetical protein